jgi:tetratricopeptide (TPR) repeat protein
MKAHEWLHNRIVAAFVLLFVLCLPAGAQTARLDALFEQLLTADPEESQTLEQEIWIEWSKSGSPAMDLLLERGRTAMAEGITDVAIDHFTALIDHAPDFAEGWNARATAYYQAGEFGPSVADIGHALTLNPRHFGALAGLGAIFEELERPEQALEVYRAALAIHPQQPGVLEAVERLQALTQGQDL